MCQLLGMNANTPTDLGSVGNTYFDAWGTALPKCPSGF
jgi:predicted glutamine amidotransferase